MIIKTEKIYREEEKYLNNKIFKWPTQIVIIRRQIWAIGWMFDSLPLKIFESLLDKYRNMRS